MRKGLFTPEQEDFLSKVLDDLFKFKNVVFESIDGFLFKMLIQTVDNQLLEKIPESMKNHLRSMVDAAMNKDYDEVRRLSVDLAVEKANFFKNSEASLRFFDGFSRMIDGAIIWYADKYSA